MNNNKPVLKSRLKEFFDTITLSGLKDREDLGQIRRIRLLHLLDLTGAFILMIMGVIVFFEGNTFLAILDLGTASILLLLRTYLKLTENYNISSLSALTLMSVFYLFFYITGGSQNTGHLWAYTLPLIASFLVGSKRGLIVSLLFLLGVIISNFIDLSLHTTYLTEFKVRFAISFFTVSMFAYYLELLRENTDKRLMDKNNHLVEVIDGLNIAKKKLTKAKDTADVANRSKSEFLRNMSHELRTPLNHIIGFSQLIRDEIPGKVNDAQKEYIEDILGSSEHLLSLINDLLDLARIEAGKQDLKIETINLSKLLEQSLEMFKEKGRLKELDFKIKMKDLQKTLNTDKRKLVQILYNLLSNAVKFSKPRGVIILSAYNNTKNKEIIISVSDNGIGMAQESMELIFDTFGQVESEANRRFEGTGLGLALTKNLVELQGGRLWAESAGIGKGSTFSFTLPLDKIQV